MDDVKILEGTNLSLIKVLELEAKKELSKIKFFILLYLGPVSLFFGLSVSQFGFLAQYYAFNLGLSSTITLTVLSIVSVYKVLKWKAKIRQMSNNKEEPIKLNFRMARRESIETKERIFDFNQLVFNNKSKQIKFHGNGGNGKRKS